MKGSARRRAPHVGRLDIARDYQASTRRLAWLVTTEIIALGHKGTRTHRMERRSNVGWRRVA